MKMEIDVRVRIPSDLLARVRANLARPHAHAAERVGFICCRVGPISSGVVVLAHDFRSVDDEDYVENSRFGALMGPGAIRKALEYAYNNETSMLHVHVHAHAGRPRFSRIDLSEYPKFIPDFWNVQPGLPHGALVLSQDSAAGLVWFPQSRTPHAVDEIWEIGPAVRRL